MTERTVELALADHWLDHVQGPVIEVGAVTPYYWPGRISRIVDPWDSHPRVTNRVSLFDLDFTDADVLCLSTLEHVGTGEYGEPTDAKGPIQAFAHLTKACRDYLISMPFGMHPDIDATIFSDRPPRPARYLVRSVDGNDWRECAAHEARVPLKQKGPSRNAFSWANGLAILSRGGEL